MLINASHAFTFRFIPPIIARCLGSAHRSDSMETDADKIRAKRLAKLGGSSTAASSTSSPTAAPAAAAEPPSTNANSDGQAASSKPSQDEATKQQQTPTQPQVAEKKPVAPQITVKPRTASPAKRERDGSERQRAPAAERAPESLETWQDRILRQVLRVTLQPEEVKDIHGNPLIFLASARQDITEQQGENARPMLSVDVLDGALHEAGGQAPNGNTFEYLLACFKRVSRTIRSTKYTGPEDPRHGVLREARRLCMSYCIFAVTIPEMFGGSAPAENPLLHHLLGDPESDVGVCTDFLTEVSARLEEDDSIKEAIVSATEELSRSLGQKDMLGDYQNHVRALRNLVRFPKIVDAITQSSIWAPKDTAAQDIENQTLLGPFFRLSPMQQSVANSYFSAPKTRDRGFIANAQNAIRMTLRTHQHDLFSIADTIVRSGPAPRERMLQWFALCVNTNHKKRAMRVDYKTVSSDGFMVNVTTILNQLCNPFMDVNFGKIEKIDVDYLRRSPRVDISDETKINIDQKASEEFYAKPAEGTNNFISEIFFLTVASHHYGTEAAQTRIGMMRKTVQRLEKDVQQFEAERHKYLSVRLPVLQHIMTFNFLLMTKLEPAVSSDLRVAFSKS